MASREETKKMRSIVNKYGLRDYNLDPAGDPVVYSRTRGTTKDQMFLYTTSGSACLAPQPSLPGERGKVDQVSSRIVQGGPLRLDAIHRAGAPRNRSLRPVARKTQGGRRTSVDR